MSRKPLLLEDEKGRKLRARRFNRYLVLILFALSLAGAVVSSLYFYTLWQQEDRAAASRLETFTELRHYALLRFLTSHQKETELWSSHESIVRIARNYIRAWERLTPRERSALRYNFIPPAQRKSKDAPIPRPLSQAYMDYLSAHAWTAPVMQDFCAHHGYGDVYIFTPGGDLAYTAAKRDDYGRNFAAGGGGPYAETALGKVFREALKSGKKGKAFFHDFEPYAPGGGAPAAFFAAPIVETGGRVVGVYAIQAPAGRFDDTMQYSSGLGETGETYAVGPDFLMRNNSRLRKEPSLLRAKVETPAVKAALEGRTVLMTGRNFRGHESLVAARPLDFGGVRWAIVTEMELAELRGPFAPYQGFYLLSIIFIMAFAFIQYWMIRDRGGMKK